MSDAEEQDDFLDKIFVAEQTKYTEVYDHSYSLASGTLASLEDGDLVHRPELFAAWARGVRCGADLSSELYAYLGLAKHLISAANSVGELPVDTAYSLLQLLTQPPSGLLNFPCDQMIKLASFDADIIRVRSKARQLLSLVGVSIVKKNMDKLSF